jgi:DNA invertase Pin-like site-specific DNA recombinase
MPAIAYSYIRFSSEPQAWGDSRRRQTGMADRYAAKHGLILDKALTFKDLGVSAFRGRNLRTGALGAFLDAVEQGIIRRGSYLLVESFDRLSRNQILPAQVLFLQIIQAGIILVTLIDDRVYSADSINANPYELLISLVAMMRANEESAYKSIRLKKAWAAKRARARVTPLTSRCPAWLWLDRSTRTFKICEDRAETVCHIFREALDGKGREAIAKTLNQDRVPVMSGRDFSLSHWQSGMVARILKSPAVTGTLIPHKVEYVDGKRVYKALPPIAGYYPAIVDSEQFAQVQRLREQRLTCQQSWSGSRRQGNIFAWLACCPLCKASMRLIVCTQPHWRYLVCSRAFLHAGCKRRGVRYPELEDAFVDAIDDIIAACPWPRAASTTVSVRFAPTGQTWSGRQPTCTAVSCARCGS